MPLDGHAYLVSQGWKGKGTGLRQGAIARPVTIAQKKSLAGVGKDRDDAFPFWDHVFQAAAVSIQVKLHKDEDDSDSEGTSTPIASLERTSTGIISHRRPKTGTPVISGTVTPDPQGSGSVTPRLSVMAAAKQEAARRSLYAMFFRGPVIAPDTDKDDPKVDARDDSTGAVSGPSSHRAHTKRKKRKLEEDSSERRKRRRQETAIEAEEGSVSRAASDEGQTETTRKAEKAERTRRKEEKRARKEDRRRRKEQLDNGLADEGKDSGVTGAHEADAPLECSPVKVKKKHREHKDDTQLDEHPSQAVKKRKR